MVINVGSLKWAHAKGALKTWMGRGGFKRWKERILKNVQKNAPEGYFKKKGT